ncbi:M12 family metallopeptidase [Polyangium mundeleinium]|uniref:M12 family metallopeptidase n=1 Tax=Polyangium mundeleinium TaxID=2995306 RepID=A0ABT5EKB9_9BACT|nr:M12 family metallopeptidase [Polyangium mundeleinium]MDC0741924.1 M12 family metallopeptidase [Polyangium mundeleinium]
MNESLRSLSGALGLLLSVAACSQGSSSAPTRTAGPPPGTWSGVSQASPQQAEVYRPAAPRYFGSAFIYLANNVSRQLVGFDVVDGLAVMEGDMMLGPATLVPFRYGTPPRPTGDIKGAMGLQSRTDLWPRGEIPYVIDASVPPATVEGIGWAVSHVNTTQLRLRPRAGDADYVVFRNSGEGSGCSSYVGRIGGPQEIQVADCGRGSIVHEILHAAGFFHEQSRNDRDQYVTIVWDEIPTQYRSDFEQRGGVGQDIGPYDYQSIMHYSSRAFSRTGRPTIVPRDPNANIGQREGLSQLDRSAIQVLYGTGGAPELPTPQPSLPFPGTTFPFPTAGLPLPSLPFPIPSFPFPTTQPAPPPTPPQVPATPVSFTGNYSSTRGPMQCSENASMVACSFQDGGAPGRLDCVKDAGSVQLSCTWMTFLPRPGAGRAALRRSSTADPNLGGTWGNLQNETDGGRWDATRQ